MYNKVEEILPDAMTYVQVLNKFVSDGDLMMVNQLIMIGEFVAFDDEHGNKRMLEWIKNFVCDLKVANQLLVPKVIEAKKLFGNEEDNDLVKDLERRISEIEIKTENLLLPMHRKITRSAEDLVENVLKLSWKIYQREPMNLFMYVMDIIEDLRQPYDSNMDSEMKLDKLKKEKEAIKKEIFEQGELEEELKKKKEKERKKRREIDQEIDSIAERISGLEKNLFEILGSEKAIYLRVIKMCQFLIKYCDFQPSNFLRIVEDYIKPSFEKKEYSEVVFESLTSMGILTINHNDYFPNFIDLFIKNLIKSKENFPEVDFKELEMTSLAIVFDSVLKNAVANDTARNEQLSEVLFESISSFLFCNSLTAKIITFVGALKLIWAQRIDNPEFILSKLILVLFLSYKFKDNEEEEFSYKIKELFQNFLFLYMRSSKSNVNTFLKAIQLLLFNLIYSKPTVKDSLIKSKLFEITAEYLYQMLSVVVDEEIPFLTRNKINFKSFKFVIFMVLYVESQFKSGKLSQNNYKGIVKRLEEVCSTINWGERYKTFPNDIKGKVCFYLYLINKSESGMVSQLIFGEGLVEKTGNLVNQSFVEIENVQLDFKTIEFEYTANLLRKREKYDAVFVDFIKFFEKIDTEKKQVNSGRKIKSVPSGSPKTKEFSSRDKSNRNKKSY